MKISRKNWLYRLAYGWTADYSIARQRSTSLCMLFWRLLLGVFVVIPFLIVENAFVILGSFLTWRKIDWPKSFLEDFAGLSDKYYRGLKIRGVQLAPVHIFLFIVLSLMALADWKTVVYGAGIGIILGLFVLIVYATELGRWLTSFQILELARTAIEGIKGRFCPIIEVED